MKISVFGGGSWGTALAHQMARCQHEVLVWAREPEVAEGLNTEHRNRLFLSDMELHPGVCGSTDLATVAEHSDVWIWVVPVQFASARWQ